MFSHFDFFATGEGEATGEGLAAGLGLVAGVVAGDAAGAGVDVPAGLFELFAGSQAAANRVTRMVGSSSARLIDVVTELRLRELLIGFCLVRARLKSGRIIARTRFTSNGCSHRSFTGITAPAELKPSFASGYLHDLRTRERVGKRAEKVARGETSGSRSTGNCALEVRADLFARLQRAKEES